MSRPNFKSDDVLPSPPVPIIVNLQYEELRKKLTLLIPISEQLNEDGSPVDDTCMDRMNCAAMKAFCNVDGYANVRFYCQKSCNACAEEPTLSTTMNPLMTTTACVGDLCPTNPFGAGGSAPAGECADRGNRCPSYKPYCGLEQWRQLLEAECQLTCNFCSPSGQATPAPSLDPIVIAKDPETGEWQTTVTADCADMHVSACAASVNLCGKAIYRQNCPKTCGSCKLPPGMEDNDADSCDDLSQSCAAMTEFCNKEGYVENMKLLCPKSCGFECKTKTEIMGELGMTAPPPTTTPAVTQATTPPAQEDTINIPDPNASAGPQCKDNHQSCPSMALLCNNEKSKSKLAKLCPLTCKICTPDGVDEDDGSDDTCADLGPGCGALEYMCADDVNQMMSRNCPKTCGLCEGGTPPPVGPPKCVDKLPTCGDYSNFCESSSGLKSMCASTCGTCPETTQAPETAAPTVAERSTVLATTAAPTTPIPTTAKATTIAAPAPAGPQCKDKSTNCPKEWCSMPGPKKRQHTRANCKATCNLCPKTVATEAPTAGGDAAPCVDKKPNACRNYYRTKCNVATSQAFVTENCQKTCNLCGKTSAADTTVADSATTECKDAKPRMCKQYGKARCTKPAYRKTMNTSCKKTCGKCAGASGQAKPAPAKPTGGAGGVCKDVTPAKCKTYGARRCAFKKYAPYMSKNCKATCGKCTGGTKAPEKKPSGTAGAGDCKDIKPKLCSSLTKKRCEFAKYKKTMATNCQKTCGKCANVQLKLAALG